VRGLLSSRPKFGDIHRVLCGTLLCLALLYVGSNLLASLRGDAGGGFGILSSLRMTPAFADLRHLTTLSGCSDAIVDIDRGTAMGCDHWGRQGLGYPPMIFFITRALGVNESETELIALVVGFSFLLIIVRRYWRVFIDQGWLGMWLCIGIFIGMPVQLGLERMNLDLAVFSLMYLLCRVIARPESEGTLGPGGKLGKSMLVVLVSLIISGAKIYPGGGLLLWLAYNRDRRNITRLDAASCSVGAVGGLIVGIVWLLNGSRTAAPGIGLITHGLYLGHGQSPLSIAEVVLALASFSIALATGVYFCGAQHTKEYRGYLSQFATLTCLTWIACFIIGPSFDYRLILLIPSVCELSVYGFRRYRKEQVNSKEARCRRLLCGSIPIVYIVLCLSPIVYFANEHYTKASVLGSHSILAVAGLLFKYIAFYATRLGDICGLPFVCASLLVVVFSGKVNNEKFQITSSDRLKSKR